jgi:hypothetical protein
VRAAWVKRIGGGEVDDLMKVKTREEAEHADDA